VYFLDYWPVESSENLVAFGFVFSLLITRILWTFIGWDQWYCFLYESGLPIVLVIACRFSISVTRQ